MDLKILEIAADTKNCKKISNFTHSYKLKNTTCGDIIEIQLIIKKNEISDFGYDCNSCIYCQASASILSKSSINKTLDEVKYIILISKLFFDKENSKFPKEWSMLQKLFSEENKPRKECILLPFKTLSKALK